MSPSLTRRWRRDTASGMTSPITTTLVDPDNARPFLSTTHAGRVCVAVPAGQRFAVRSTSQHTTAGGRLEWIVAVDGRDTLTNKPASQRAAGLISGLSYTCRGFRTGDDEVREFVCANLGDNATTTERNGTAGSAGLVAVVAYAEREREVVTYRGSGTKGMSFGGVPTRGAAVLCSAIGAATGPTAGAAAGAAVLDRVGRTSWERGTRIGSIVIEYDTPEGWALRGVSFAEATPLPEREAWPGDVRESRTDYCDAQTL